MKTLSLFAVLLLLTLQACSSDNSNAGAANSPETNTSGEQTNNTSGLISSSNTDIPSAITSASRAIVFDYTMDSVRGGNTVARALLFEPTTTAPADGHPLVVWAHGTTGISQACQPSENADNLLNTFAINELLATGYAVLAPDYEGFGTDRIHPYYQRSSHANSVTFAVQAVHKLPDMNLSDDWAIVGHSQGGHVALATARAAAMPAYPLQAVVALAPGTDLRSFSDRAFEAVDIDNAAGNLSEAGLRFFYLQVYSAYVAHAMAEVDPSFDPKSIFGEDMTSLVDLAVNESFCGQYATAVSDLLNSYFSINGEITSFQGLKRDWYNTPAIDSRLAAEELGDESQAAPLLILQGDADLQIPIAEINAFADRQRSLGTDLTYEIIPDADHGDVARKDFGQALTWLTDRFPAQ